MASFAIATPTAVSPRGGGSGGGSSSSGGGGSSGGSGSSSGGGSSGEGSDYVPCSGLYNQANCCDVAVLGVADLNCATGKALITFKFNPSALLYKMNSHSLTAPI